MTSNTGYIADIERHLEQIRASAEEAATAIAAIADPAERYRAYGLLARVAIGAQGPTISGQRQCVYDLADAGRSNEEIAEALGTRRQMVSFTLADRSRREVRQMRLRGTPRH